MRSGWGSADLGGAWTIPAGGDQFSTANGGGRMRLQPGDGYQATLDAVRLTTTDITVATSAGTVPDAVGHYNAVLARSVGSASDYRFKVRTAADGSVAAWLVRRVDGVETVLSSGGTPQREGADGTDPAHEAPRVGAGHEHAAGQGVGRRDARAGLLVADRHGRHREPAGRRVTRALRLQPRVGARPAGHHLLGRASTVRGG